MRGELGLDVANISEGHKSRRNIQFTFEHVDCVVFKSPSFDSHSNAPSLMLIKPVFEVVTTIWTFSFTPPPHLLSALLIDQSRIN